MGLRTKNKRAAVSPGPVGAEMKRGFQNLGTERLLEDPQCGNRRCWWCWQQLAEGELQGASSAFHMSPPPEVPSLAKLKGRSQRERPEAVSVTASREGGRPIYLGAEKIL